MKVLFTTIAFPISLFVCGVSLADTYTVTDLGTLAGMTGSGGAAINASGKVVGGTFSSNGTRAVLFSGTGSGNTDLGTLGGSSGYARGINDAGQIVGFARVTGDSPTRAALFSGTGSNNTDLGTLGGAESIAYAINSSGQIVGSADVSGAIIHATLFSGTGSNNTDLGTLDVAGSRSYAYAINDAGQAVGYSYLVSHPAHATLFSGTGSNNTDLGTLGGTNSYAYAINAGGQIVGASNITGDGASHAVLFSGTGSGNTDLQTLGGTGSSASGINASGQIVGSSSTAGNAANHGFLFTGGTMIDLNTLIAPGSGWEITDAVAINDAGQIAAAGRNASRAFHALLLTLGAGPTPPKPVAAPVIKPAGKKKVTTAKAKLLIKGTVTGVVTSVTYRVGSKGVYKAARGTRAWKFKAKLKPGKNVVTVIAHGPGGDSVPARLKVIRQ